MKIILLKSFKNKHSRFLWKISSSVLINAASVQDVEECVADVFIYLWQYPEKYDPDRAKLSSWLSVVTRSKAIDRYRRIIKTREIPIENMVAGRMEYAATTGGCSDEEKERLR